ncbi:exodeoxyribonuclease III [bacterium]|nr:exodeoxyribonuclease III [bacterium]
MAKYPRIYSWNVNGMRACVSKGFCEWMERTRGDIVAMQEVRAGADRIPEAVLSFDGYRTHFYPAQRAGYSGVGLMSRRAPDEIVTSIGETRFDAEGRVQMARFGKLLIVNVYVPNGNGKDRDLSRIPYKLDFSRRLFDVLEPERRAGGRILVMGDFNTAHEEIDIARPKDNVKNSGFRPEERAEFGRWLEGGWIDTFRAFEKNGGHYTWWSQRFGVREKNIGWRIDYILASPAAMEFVKRAEIHAHDKGSDHCPISVAVVPGIFK